MINHEKYYVPQLEWEFSNFPIEIKGLKFEKTNWGFEQSSITLIERDGDLKLKGIVSGYVKEFQRQNEEHFVGKGNIIKGQTILGCDIYGNIIELYGCFLRSVHGNSFGVSPSGLYIEGEVAIDSLRIEFVTSQKAKEIKTRFDWFICNDISAHFLGRTFRNLNLPNKKIRIGIDEHDDSIGNYLESSTSKDYVLVNTLELEFIVAKVPDEFLSVGNKGLCLEFRSDLDKVNDELLNGFKSFVSFLLGNEIEHIGYSLVEDGSLKEAYLYSSNKKHRSHSMPPIKFNFKYQWGNFSWLLNQFMSKYLELRKVLCLDEVLSRYWLATNIPIGSNLPVLSNALEIIAVRYLKTLDNFKFEYLPEDSYLQLIETERNTLAVKLSSIEGGDIILNKILKAFNRNPSEKLNHFFNTIGIKLGKSEKKAIALRNKMTHSARDYSQEETTHEDLVYTRVYEALFRRTILKLLGYDGYYIDYSVQGCPLKHIDKNAGNE